MTDTLSLTESPTRVLAQYLACQPDWIETKRQLRREVSNRQRTEGKQR